MDKIQWIQNKICPKEVLVYRCNGLKGLGKKIVFTNGVFDILPKVVITPWIILLAQISY